MQPEVPSIPVGSERNHDAPAPSLERVPTLPAPEAGIETGAERKEQAAELSAVSADATSIATTLQPVSVVSDTPQVDPTVSSPLTAANDDIIEKEWVDKAKKIIADTKEDPYQREKQVSQLQKDYLSKRYGKELGASS